MKRLAVFLAVILALGVAGHAQTPVNISRATLAAIWDMDGEAADNDQVVIVGNGALTDSATLTLTADPDVCRLVDITVTDADSGISAGVLTVAGTGCLGEAKSCSFTFAAAGSGIKTLTCTDGEGAYIADVTSVTTGVLTGEGAGDTVIVGYTANSANGWPMYGTKTVGPFGELGVDPFGYQEIPLKITTGGASSTTVDGVNAADDAFAAASAGDLIVIAAQGMSYERKITAKASADQVTVNAALNLPAAGTTYRLRKFWYSTNPLHRMYVPVSGARTVMFDWSVDLNANTGGVVELIECTEDRVEFPLARWVQIETNTVNSGSTQASTSKSVALETTPYSFCRIGFKFGTGDDGDGAAEDINAAVVVMR